MPNRAARRLTTARSIMWWETPVIGRPSWGNGNGEGASTHRSHVAERHVAATALDQRLVARLRGGHAIDRRALPVVEQEQRPRGGFVDHEFDAAHRPPPGIAGLWRPRGPRARTAAPEAR